MNSNLIHKYVDGLLTEPEEMALFNELSNNDEMRLELRAALTLRETIQLNSNNRVPPEAVTNSLFTTLGYSTSAVNNINYKEEKENSLNNVLVPQDSAKKDKKRFGAIILFAILTSAITSLVIWESHNSKIAGTQNLNKIIPLKENTTHSKNNQFVEVEKVSSTSINNNNGKHNGNNQIIEQPNKNVNNNLLSDKNFQSNIFNDNQKKLNAKGMVVTHSKNSLINSSAGNFNKNSSIVNKGFTNIKNKKNENFVSNKPNKISIESKEFESSEKKMNEQIELKSMTPQSELSYTSNKELTFIDKKEIVEFKKLQSLPIDGNLIEQKSQSNNINKEKWIFGVRTIIEGVFTGEKFEKNNSNTSSINNMALSAGYIINSNWKAGAEFGEESFPMILKGKDSSIQKVNSVNFYGAFVQHSFAPISNLSFFELQNRLLLGITNYGLCAKYSPTISYQPIRNIQLNLGPEFTINTFSDEPNVDFKKEVNLERKMDGQTHSPVKIGFSFGANIKF